MWKYGWPNECCLSGRAAFIVLEQSAESAVADDATCIIRPIGFIDQLQAVERDIAHSLVRPKLVAIVHVFVD